MYHYIYVYMYTYIYIYTHIYKHTYKYMYMYMYMYIYMYIYLYLYNAYIYIPISFGLTPYTFIVFNVYSFFFMHSFGAGDVGR